MLASVRQIGEPENPETLEADRPQLIQGKKTINWQQALDQLALAHPKLINFTFDDMTCLIHNNGFQNNQLCDMVNCG